MLFTRRAVTDRILKKGNATGSGGRKRYNSVFCVTKPPKQLELCENVINSVWRSTGMYTPTIFFHFSGGVPINFGGVHINSSRLHREESVEPLRGVESSRLPSFLQDIVISTTT